MRALLVSALAVLGACPESPSAPDLSAASDLSLVDLSAGPGDMFRYRSCSVIAQNCPTGQKCTLVSPEGLGLGAYCIPLMGNVAENQPCQTIGSFGEDDCGRGLMCHRPSAAATEPRACRRFCLDNRDCTTGGQVCGAPLFLPYVLCTPTCAPFGTSCAAPLTCSRRVFDTDQNVYLGCKTPGAGAPGTLCTSDTACDGTSICPTGTDAGAPTCSRLCDGTHACPSGSCAPFGDAGAGPGYCP
jgi:hypothetical protein